MTYDLFFRQSRRDNADGRIIQPDGCFRSRAERDAAHEILKMLVSFTLAVESAVMHFGQVVNEENWTAFPERLKMEGLEGLGSAASQSNEGVLHEKKGLERNDPAGAGTPGCCGKTGAEFTTLLPPYLVLMPWLRSLVAKTISEMECDAEPTPLIDQ